MRMIRRNKPSYLKKETGLRGIYRNQKGKSKEQLELESRELEAFRIPESVGDMHFPLDKIPMLQYELNLIKNEYKIAKREYKKSKDPAMINILLNSAIELQKSYLVKRP